MSAYPVSNRIDFVVQSIPRKLHGPITWRDIATKETLPDAVGSMNQFQENYAQHYRGRYYFRIVARVYSVTDVILTD